MSKSFYLLFAVLFFLSTSNFYLKAMEAGDFPSDWKGKEKVDDKQVDEITKDVKKLSLKESTTFSSSSSQEIEPNNIPCFVANIPAYVPSDSETDESDSGSADEDFKFSEDDFKEPPFKINYEKRGCVASSFTSDSKINDSKLAVNAAPSLVEDLHKKMLKTGFVEAGTINAILRKHLFMVVGLNRPRSLSSGKNKVLKKELAKSVDIDPSIKCFGMFWDFPWERTEKAKNKTQGNPPAYEEVQSYYKQLKKRDPEKARKFRRDNENHDRRRMVPYRTLRERVKSHTGELIKNFRKSNPKSRVYLFLCDSDTVSFNGCLTTFIQLDKEKGQGFDAMSTGYLYADAKDQHEMIKLASELDMYVREATAKHIPLGVYYPEPALCILVPLGQDTIFESFEDGKDDYETPQESPIILKKIKQLRTNVSFAFAYKNPIIIKAPKRATENKQKTRSGAKNKFQFCAVVSPATKNFILWSMDDLKTITEKSAQSHARPINWAHNVLDAFGSCGGVKKIEVLLDNNESIKIEGKLGKQGKQGTLGSVKKNILVSLLTRLFKSYDPISMAQGNRNTFIAILKDYDNKIKSDIIPVQKNQKVKKPIDLWEKIDGITSRALLKKVIGQLLPKKEDADLVDAAAREAGKAIRGLLFERLSLII